MTKQLHAYTHDVDAEIRTAVITQLIRLSFNKAFRANGLDEIGEDDAILNQAISEAAKTVAASEKPRLNIT